MELFSVGGDGDSKYADSTITGENLPPLSASSSELRVSFSGDKNSFCVLYYLIM